MAPDMPSYAEDCASRLQGAFSAAYDPVRARGMAKYMRDLFPFAGIPTPERTALQRQALAALPKPLASEVIAAATLLWELDEREYQYAACALLARHAKLLSPGDLPAVRRLVESKSWWDTVDTLASNVVGPMVAGHPELSAEMDLWISDENIWVARTAILHQLRYKSSTDRGRLFRYCELQAAHPDFFIRKAIGWALREYSKTDGDAVRGFVASHETALSPLSRKEALLWLNGGRTGSKPR